VLRAVPQFLRELSRYQGSLLLVPATRTLIQQFKSQRKLKQDIFGLLTVVGMREDGCFSFLRQKFGKISRIDIRTKIFSAITIPLGAGIATGLTSDGPEFRVPVGSRIFFASSRPTLGSAQPPIQRVRGLFRRG
jgi:hypothetical protein